MYRNLFCLILIHMFTFLSSACSADTLAVKPSESTAAQSLTQHKEAPEKKNSENTTKESDTKESETKVPVMIGHYDDLDACLTFAMVGVKTLAARQALNSASKQADTIKEGQYVWICDVKSPWAGIVYSNTDEDCEVGNTIDSGPIPYQGKCQSGWVEEKNLEALAG